MVTETVHFCLYDEVIWDAKRFPQLVRGMQDKYGKGRFKVVQVRLHTKEARESSPTGHPEAVTIELTEDGERHEFSGDWFKVVKRFRG